MRFATRIALSIQQHQKIGKENWEFIDDRLKIILGQEEFIDLPSLESTIQMVGLLRTGALRNLWLSPPESYRDHRRWDIVDCASMTALIILLRVYQIAPPDIKAKFNSEHLFLAGDRFFGANFSVEPFREFFPNQGMREPYVGNIARYFSNQFYEANESLFRRYDQYLEIGDF